MAKKLFTILSKMEKTANEDGFITIRGMASTDDQDRGGDIILSEAWTKGGLDNFNNNPIILFQHNSNRPIGKCTEIRVVERGLEITAKISKSDPVAALVEQGVVTAFSVGARIRDADYLKETGGLVIKDAELYEVSVVSIPANQKALFSVVKSFGTESELELYNKSIEEKPEAIVEVPPTPEGKPKMDKEEILKLLADAFAAQKVADEKEAKEKAEDTARADKIAKDAADAATAAVTAAVTSITDRTETLINEAVAKATSGTTEELVTLRNELKEKSEEITSFVNSKRKFEANGTKDWEKAAEPLLRDAYVLGAILRKNWMETDYGKGVIEKVNGMSGVSVPTVSTAVYENIVNTSIERDIQHALVLAPLFREIGMNAATMTLPILPDAGYAEFIATKKLANTGDDAPNGNLEVRGATEGSPYGGVALGSKILSTKKIMSVSFLANETEEDTILAILPLIQEQMVRSHTRAVERAMLRGNSGIGSFDGLGTIAVSNSSQLTSGTAFATDALTAQDLLNMRKTMGKYGIDPKDVIYIVNEREYYNLMDDQEFKDANLVTAANATKLTGQVGNLYGSRVMLCDEFLTPAINVQHALAVNTRNFLVPRLRGVTLESQYIPRAQHLELVATQRLGFDQLIDGAKAVISRRYAAA